MARGPARPARLGGGTVRILDSIPHPTLVLGRDGAATATGPRWVLHANPPARALLRWETVELPRPVTVLGETPGALLDRADADLEDLPITTGDGNTRIVNVHLGPLVEAEDVDGVVLELVTAQIHDVTHEFPLRERYRILAELVTDIAFVFRVSPSLDVTPEWFSESFFRVTGYTLEDWDRIGGWNGLLHPEDTDIVLPSLARALTGETVVNDVRLVTASGDIRNLRAFIRPLVDPETGEVTRVFGAAIDATDTARAHALVAESAETVAALERTERQWRAISALLSEAAFSFHAEGDALVADWMTDSFLAIAGVPPGTAPEDIPDWREFVAPADHAAVEAAVEAACAGQTVRFEHRVVDPGGERWVETALQPILDDETGRVVQVVGATRDIDDIRRALHTMELENEAKAEVMSLLSHDVRHPLTILAGYAATLRRLDDRIDPARREEMLQRLEMNALELDDMLERILGMLRTGAAASLHIETVSVQDLVMRVIERNAPRLEGRPLEVDVPNGLVVHADPDAVVHVLDNLVVNAAKYSPDDSPIALTARETGATVEVSVVDQGTGIPEEERELVFERFFRGSEVRDRTRGTGMGLTISKNFVEQMGGRIWVESQLGEGSTFTFTLPMAALAPAQR